MGLFKNKSKMVHIKFGVPFFEVFDCKLTDFSVPVAVRGEISFFVKNYKKFLKQNGFDGMNWEEFQVLVRSAVIRYAKDFVANAPAKYKIPVVHLEKKINKLSEILKTDLKNRIKKEFKIQVSNVDVTAIEVDTTSKNYQHLKSVTKDIVTDTILTNAEIELEDLRDKAKADSEDYRENLGIKRETKKILQKLLIPAFVFVAILILVLLVLILK